MKFQIVHQVNGPFAGQDWVTNGPPLFDSREEAESYLASGALSAQDPYDKTRVYTYYVREADQYPACIDETPSPDESCQHEYCPRHTIMWLESEGLTHAAAVGIAGVLDQVEHESSDNIIIEALGGFDSFNQVTDFCAVWESAPLTEWYESHQPLVAYCLEKSDWSGTDYWYQAKYHQTRVQ